MNKPEYIDNLVELTIVAVRSGRQSRQDVMRYVRELARYIEPGDNLRLVEAAALAGCKSGLEALKWSRDIQREISKDADAHARAVEKKTKVVKARKPAGPADPADNAA